VGWKARTAAQGTLSGRRLVQAGKKLRQNASKDALEGRGGERTYENEPRPIGDKKLNEVA